MRWIVAYFASLKLFITASSMATSSTLPLDLPVPESAATPKAQGRSKGRPKKVVAPVETFSLPPVLLVPVGLVAYLSRFTGQKITEEQVIQEAVIAYLEQLQKPGSRQVELPPTMLAALRQFKESLQSSSSVAE